MALQYVSSDEKDFSGGIDARSSENQISPSFVKELLNADVVEKRVRKRPGYQGFAGNVPVRVTKLEYKSIDNQVCFTLDSAISLNSTVVDLGLVGTSPLVVYGRTSSTATGSGPFSPTFPVTDACNWYSKFTVLTKKSFSLTDTPIFIPAEEHGISGTELFSQAVQLQAGTNDRSYETTIPNEIKVDKSSYGISVEYINSTSADIPVYIYYKDRTPVAGESFVKQLSHPGGIDPLTGFGVLETFNIPATGLTGHNLRNFNIIPQLQISSLVDWALVKPETFVINSDGSVDIGIRSSSSATFRIILSAADFENQATGNVSAGATHTIELSNLTSPWIFYGVYLEAGGIKNLVYPDLIQYDDATRTAVITFTNNQGTAQQFNVFYEYGYLRSNQLCVTDTSVPIVDGVDNRPQITLWGLDHDSIYGENPGGRAGWVTHIDSYTSAGEQRMLCGLGGNLFASYTASERGGSYKYAQLYPRLQARTAAAKVLAPLFWDSGETPQRTRGYITSSSSGTHWAKVSSVLYETGSLNPRAGYTKYTLSLPSMAILDMSGTPTSLSSVISTTTNLEDYLTLQNMSYKRHNGIFKIVEVAAGPNEIYIWVENENNSSDYNDANTNGEAGVFTDQFETLITSPFLAGDQVYNAALDESVYTATSSSGTTTVINGVVDIAQVSAGLITVGIRTSSVVPMRISAPTYTAATTNLVQGDMLSYTGSTDDRKIRVLSINAGPDLSATITGNGTTATATVPDTSFLVSGRKIVIYSAGVYSGVQTIEAVTGTTTFTFASKFTDSAVSGVVAGHTAEIDEELTWQDSENDADVFVATERWLPVEAPDDQYSATPNTYVRHFDTLDYGVQPFIRSTTVVNNMYLTNYEDEVMKFDGASIYRAGLFPWQPGLFITQNTAASAKIVLNLRSFPIKTITTALAAAGQIEVEAEYNNAIPVGTAVRLDSLPETYIVRSYEERSNKFFVSLDRAITTLPTLPASIYEIATRQYYFRLDAVDANNNIVASAMTGYQDHVVELTQNAAVNIRLVGMPVWDVYDYDRIYVNVYATKASARGIPVFYKLASVPVKTASALDLQSSFENTQGYIDFVDSFSDESLTELDDVAVLTGGEIGLSWQEPLRSKYITSIGNRLVQANLRDYPQLDIQIQADANTSESTYAGKKFLFRRDSSSTDVGTSVGSFITYEFKSATTGTVSSGSRIANTSFTVVLSGGVSSITPGGWIYLTYDSVASSGRDLTYSGWWQIASKNPATNSVTINYTAKTPVGATFPNRYVLATDSLDVPVLLGVDGNMGMANGKSSVSVTFDVGRRLAMAINASMRMVDTSLYPLFTPWLTARGGNDVGQVGRIIVRQPKSGSIRPSVVLPSSFSGGSGTFSVFVNGIGRTVGAQIEATVRAYPSRLTLSYENYPEIVDAPTAILDTESQSAIDVNSADGQEITGIIPFFGETAFSAAQQEAVLVVFKTNSIYLVDVAKKAAGQPCIQKIETEGLGCTAPYSIARTKKGIIFANESGIYCLRRDQSIQYLGRYMERNWVNRVNRDLLDLCQGHHYGVGRSYKLSVPLLGETACSEVYVYNHTGEDYGQNQLGAWGRYDSHPATGWANLAADAFFGATHGRVYSIRRQGTETDFRDDNMPIAFQLDTRALDFGNSGIRKVLDSILIDYRVPVESTGTAVLYAADTQQEYRDSTAFTIQKSPNNTGLDDQINRDIQTIRHDTDRRRGNYFQVRVTNFSIDEGLEIAGMSFRVGGLSDRGTKQARQTRK